MVRMRKATNQPSISLGVVGEEGSRQLRLQQAEIGYAVIRKGGGRQYSLGSTVESTFDKQVVLLLDSGLTVSASLSEDTEDQSEVIDDLVKPTYDTIEFSTKPGEGGVPINKKPTGFAMYVVRK